MFIGADGTIARIAKPSRSTTPFPAGDPIAAVLELRGGRAAELGIREGDRWSGTLALAACTPRNDAAKARTHGFLVENIHLVERRDVGNGAVDPALRQRGRPGRAGNVYYQDKKRPWRRWVIYNGANDGSRVPPDWQLWLRGTIEDLPEKALPPVRKFQKEPTPNLTGTMEAFRPDGRSGSGRMRPASTGDYEPWIPE